MRLMRNKTASNAFTEPVTIQQDSSSQHDAMVHNATTSTHSQHDAMVHTHAEFHHGHSHAEVSHHAGGHHLLQVQNLSIGFTMYKDAELSNAESSNTYFSNTASTKKHFSVEQYTSQVIDNLSLSVHTGEILAIVGASGSGKTLLADAILGLYATNARVEGTIYYDGVLQDAKSLAQLRGREIAFVPQSVKSLDPLMKVGKQIGGSAQRRAELFERYGLSRDVEDRYPFELSGGMARRVLLCTALMTDPRLIIADEPTPGLDLELAVKAMEDFRVFANEGKGVLLITHDIELALRVADRVAVFKDGTVVEETAVANFTSPDLLQHPFSKALWHALPEHDFIVSKDYEACINAEALNCANVENSAEATSCTAAQTGDSMSKGDEL